MLLREQHDGFAPASWCQWNGTRKPVRPLARKRTSRFAREHSTNGVLPISGMQDDLPDVMPSWAGPPGSYFTGQPACGSLEVRPVPGLFFIALIDDVKQQSDLAIQWFPSPALHRCAEHHCTCE